MELEAHPETLFTGTIDRALRDVSSRCMLSGAEVIDLFLDLRLVADEVRRLPWCELVPVGSIGGAESDPPDIRAPVARTGNGQLPRRPFFGAVRGSEAGERVVRVGSRRARRPRVGGVETGP